MNYFKSKMQTFINWYKINFTIDKYELADVKLIKQSKNIHSFNAVINCYDKKMNLILSKPFDFQMVCKHSSEGIILKEYWDFQQITDYYPIPPEGTLGYWNLCNKLQDDFYELISSNPTLDYTTKKFVPKDLKRLDGLVNIKEFLS